MRHLFSLSASQYKNKYDKLLGSGHHDETDDDSSTLIDDVNQMDLNHAFCEVNIVPELTPELNAKADDTRASIKKIKDTKSNPLTYCDNNTVIVECIRADGQRLKIHTVNQSAQKIVSNFFGGQ